MKPVDRPTSASKWVDAFRVPAQLSAYLGPIGIGAGVFLAGGLAVVLGYHKGAAVGFFWALSSFGVGGIIGFLFGFPRTVRLEVVRPAPPGPGGKAEAGAPAPAGVPADIEFQHLPNTHLEEVSDWLTKIIIGLTLVQFREIAASFRDGAALFAAGLEGGATADNLAFAPAVMVYFSLLGFLFGFLLTRLFLPQALRVSDQLASMRKRVSELGQQISGLGQQVSEVGQVVQKEVSQLRQVVESARLGSTDAGGTRQPVVAAGAGSRGRPPKARRLSEQRVIDSHGQA